MSLYPPPELIQAEPFFRVPDALRIKNTAPDWARANKPGHMLDCFLEGPSFDKDGNLWLTDIPYGRIFKVTPSGDWSVVAEYDGWPNGLKLHPDGSAWLADYRHGIMRLDPATGEVKPVLTHRYSEHFRGCNDLVFDSAGRLYFTDQGQSGLHMPNGRVYRYDPASEVLDLLIDTGQSPNGLVLNLKEDVLFVAMTRGNSVWRLPLMADGGVSKVGIFIQLSGGLSGPDGLALDESGGVWIAHAGNGCVWGFSAMGEPKWRIVGGKGLTTTNIAFGGEGNRYVYVTESDTGTVLRAEVPVAGRPMYSHTGE
ncbi:SMP-30/gluconolactonase/LRE family protein [Acuticoccus mangrovi]|nr:SMP-30/gluconolactonase/LRE family protein [Acuticoccus mangrovi]